MGGARKKTSWPTNKLVGRYATVQKATIEKHELNHVNNNKNNNKEELQFNVQFLLDNK